MGTIVGFTIGPFVVEMMFPDADLTSRTVGLLAAGSGVYMLALACAQAVIALGGHRDQAFGWLLGMAALGVSVWLVSDDLFLRVELALLLGSVAALIAMAGSSSGSCARSATTTSTPATSSKPSTTSPSKPDGRRGSGADAPLGTPGRSGVGGLLSRGVGFCRANPIQRRCSMPNFRELLAATKAEIREVDTAKADELRRQPGAVVLDVREPDEYEQGAIPGAVHIPPGTLESSVENRIADKSAPVVIHCASGVRSAFAAKTLGELGYTNVVSVAGGFNRWKDEGRDWSTPRKLGPSSATATSATCCCPRSASRASSSCSTPRCCCWAPAASARPPRCTWPPPAWARSASSTWTSSTSRTCSARSSTTSTGSASARSTRPRRRSPLLNPDVNVVTHDVRLGADNVMDILSRLRRRHRRRRQLPRAVPAQRRGAEAGDPRGPRLDLPVRGPGHGVQALRRPCYRCFLPEPPPAELAPSCAEAGVLGVLPGIIGSIQALEAIKLILGIGDDLSGRLLAYDSLEQSFRTFKVRRDPECPTCSIDPERIVIAEYDELCMPHPIAPPPAGSLPALPNVTGRPLHRPASQPRRGPGVEA